MREAPEQSRDAKREIQWRCPQCLAPQRQTLPPPAVGPWRCGQCGGEQPAQPDAFDDHGELRRCPVCGCPDLYRQRDFNRRLGLAIIVVGAVLAPFTMFLSLVVCALIDLAIYRTIGDVAVCYHCQAIMRDYPGTEKIEPFDLNVSDKYIEVERRRGW